MLNGRGKKWKAAILDYDALQSYDDETKCVVCLTEREAAALHGYIRGMSWSTRWANLPLDFDLQTWVAGIESELISTMCGNNPAIDDIARCLCELTELTRQQIQIDLTADQPVIPPDNPAENLPALTPTTAGQQLRYDAALCDISKLTTENIFELVYRGKVEKCNENEGIDWAQVAINVAGALFVAATIWTGGTAKILFSAGLGAVGAAIGDLIFDYNAYNDAPAGCPPERVPVELSRIYGCQLWQSLQVGITFSIFQQSLTCPNPVAIEWYKSVLGRSQSEAEAADAETRDLLSNFVRNGDVYKGVINGLNDLADNPYYPTEVCGDCTDCSNTSPPIIQITEWTDPRITSITPAPFAQNSTSDWSWRPADTEVTVVLDKTYCLRAFDATLKRGATVGAPSRINVNVGSETRSDSTGGFGDGNITVDLDGLAGKAFTFIGNVGFEMRLDLGDANKGIKLDPLPQYNDC